MSHQDDLVRQLEEVLPGRVLTDVNAYLKDWWPLLTLTDEKFGEPSAAVKPVNVDELSKLLSFSSSAGIPVYVRGGGSSVTGASIPTRGIVADTSRLDQILDFDDSNRTVTAQAGVKLSALEAKLNEKGFTLSQFPDSFDLATVGGYVSTLGTGQYSTLYGGIEDAVLRLQVVLSTGEVVWTRTRGVPRSSVGPDLSRLFIGAEGSFGVVSAVELKVRKLPSYVWKAAFTFSSFEGAVAASRSLMDFDIRPAVCRAYNEVESQFLFGENGCVFFVVYHFRSQSIMKALREEVSERLEAESSPTDPGLVDSWLGKRFSYREQTEAVNKLGYSMETLELAARWSRLTELYREAAQVLSAIEGVGAVGAHVSHLYDQGASLTFLVLFHPNKDTYRRVWDATHDAAKSHDATISHHHGVGILKKVYAKDEVPLSLLKKLKEALDPKGTMSPDRFP